MKRLIFILLLASSCCAQVGTTLGAPATCLRTFYIDFVGGADANNGTAKVTPWKHHPYMKGWTGTYAHAAQDCFIFKGGVSWTATNFAGAGAMNIVAGGNSTQNDYYGVDKTWFTGGSWARPIFDAQSSTTVNTIILIASGVNYVTFDSIEVRGLWLQANVNGWSIYAQGAPNTDITLNNLYVHNVRMAHGWTNDGAVGFIYFCCDTGAGVNTYVQNSLIDNSDGGYMASGDLAIQTAKAGGVAVSRVQTMTFTTIQNVSSVFLHGGQTVHDNTIQNTVSSWDGTYHTNNLYVDFWTHDGSLLTSYVYRNKLINTNASAAPLYPNPCTQQVAGAYVIYIYDNLVYGGNPPFGLDIDAGDAGCSAGLTASVFAYNNFIQIPSADVTGCGRATPGRPGTQISSVTYDNNHCVYDSTPKWNFAAATSVTDGGHNVSQTNAGATGQGYIPATQYQPTSTTGISVNAGTAITCLSCVDIAKDINLVIRPQKLFWDAGTYELVAQVLLSGNLKIKGNVKIATPPPPAPPPAFIDAGSNNCGGAVTTCTCPLNGTNSIALGTGELAVIFLQDNGGYSGLTVTDNSTPPNTYTFPSGSSNGLINGGYAWNTNPGATTVTATWTNTMAASMVCAHYSNAQTISDPFEAAQNGSGSTSPWNTTANISVSVGDLLIGSVFDFANNATTLTETAPWANRINFNNTGRGWRELLSDQLNVASGNYQYTGTLSAADQWYSSIMAFKKK